MDQKNIEQFLKEFQPEVSKLVSAYITTRNLISEPPGNFSIDSTLRSTDEFETLTVTIQRKKGA